MIGVLTRRLHISMRVIGVSVVLLVAMVIAVMTNLQQDVYQPQSRLSSEDHAISQVAQYLNEKAPCLTDIAGFTATLLRDATITEVTHGTFVWHVHSSGLVAPQFTESC